MRTVALYVAMIVLGLISGSASFAQPGPGGYASETSESIARSLKNYHAIFGTDPRATTYALKALCMPLSPALKAECETRVEEVTRLFRNTETLLDGQPRRVDSLPDVYERQYKRGAMANMSVTDQINWARFQYAYIGFLTWYISCHPLPTIGNTPIQFPSGPVGERPPAPPPAIQSPRIGTPGN